jgi:hypothetical protein
VLDVNEALATEVAAARGAVGPMWLDGVGTVDGLRGPVVVDGRRLG